MMESRVYFIQAQSGGPIKIGISRDVCERLGSLQTSHPEKLVLLAHRPGGPDVEAHLHRQLTRYRLKGEWFEDCDAVRAEIEMALKHPQTLEDEFPPSRRRDKSGPDYRFMVETFKMALNLHFSGVPSRARLIGSLAGVSSRTAELWLQGKNFPHTANALQFARNHQGMKVWFMALGAAQGMAMDLGVSLEEGWNEIGRKPHEVIRFWHGRDQMLIALGQAP
jgi:hypothetical protein